MLYTPNGPKITKFCDTFKLKYILSFIQIDHKVDKPPLRRVKNDDLLLFSSLSLDIKNNNEPNLACIQELNFCVARKLDSTHPYVCWKICLSTIKYSHPLHVSSI